MVALSASKTKLFYLLFFYPNFKMTVSFVQRAFSEQQNNTSSTSSSQNSVTLKKDKQKVEDKNDDDDTFKEDESMYDPPTME